MRVLVTFAVDAEFAPWRKLHDFRREEIIVKHHHGRPDVVFRGKVKNSRIDVYLTGVGWRGVQAGLYQLISEKPDLCIISGLAGGLKAELRSGEIVAAREIRSLSGEGKFRSRRSLLALAEEQGATVVDSFLTNAQIVSQSQFKRSMAEFGDVVEMESAHIMKMLTGAQVPGIAIRAISDTADEDLPLDFSRTIDDHGQIGHRQLLMQIGRYPHKIPALIKFGRRSERATQNLAAFLEDYIAATEERFTHWTNVHELEEATP